MESISTYRCRLQSPATVIIQRIRAAARGRYWFRIMGIWFDLRQLQYMLVLPENPRIIQLHFQRLRIELRCESAELDSYELAERLYVEIIVPTIDSYSPLPTYLETPVYPPAAADVLE